MTTLSIVYAKPRDLRAIPGIIIQQDSIIGWHGVHRYTAIVPPAVKEQVKRIACHPLFFQLPDVNPLQSRQLILFLYDYCTRKLGVPITDVFLNHCSEEGCPATAHPMFTSDYVYVTLDEQITLSIDLTPYVGYGFISSNPLVWQVLASDSRVTAVNIDDIAFFDIDDMIIDSAIEQEVAMIREKIALLDRPSSATGLRQELTEAWGLSSSSLLLGCHVHQWLDKAVMRVLLGRPPTYDFTGTWSSKIKEKVDIEALRTRVVQAYQQVTKVNPHLAPFVSLVHVTCDCVVRIPCWSVRDVDTFSRYFSQSSPSAITPIIHRDPPDGVITTDATGCAVTIDNNRYQLLTIGDSTPEQLAILNNIIEKKWKEGYFVSPWGAYLWDAKQQVSVIYVQPAVYYPSATAAISILI